MELNEQRFRALFELHVDAVRAYAFRREPNLADDIVAETFVVAWRRFGDIPGDATLPWLIGVARNVRRNLRRSERRKAAVTMRLRPDPGLAAPPELPFDVARALSALSERDREVLLLSAWDQLGHDEIAAVLGCSRANVAVRLSRARRRFEALLDAPRVSDRVMGGAS